jgi:hypothetical protein
MNLFDNRSKFHMVAVCCSILSDKFWDDEVFIINIIVVQLFYLSWFTLCISYNRVVQYSIIIINKNNKSSATIN